MLAKELKIKTLERQKCFIEGMLRESAEKEDGNVCISYVGDIYEENIKYLEDEGFYIYREISSAAMAVTRGVPINIITINENRVKLNLTEIEESKQENLRYQNSHPISLIPYLKEENT